MTNRVEVAEPAVTLVGAPRAGGCGLERKAAALLTLLAFEGAVARSRLAALLWPCSGEKAARANLRQLLHRLRVQLGGLIEGGEVLRLSARVRVDTLSHGELLGTHQYDDCPELADWMLVTREQVRTRQRLALGAEAERREHEGDLDGALQLAEQLVHAHPESEEGHRRVMRLLNRRGDRAAALHAFERCRELTRRLFDCEVSGTTAALAEEIRRGPGAPEDHTVVTLRRDTG